MLLPLQFKHPGQRHGGLGQCCANSAAPDVIGGVVEAAGCQGLFQRENRRQWFVFDDHLFRRRAARLLRLANHQCQNMSVE